MSTVDRMILRLPDIYAKGSHSSVYKLLSLPSEQLDEVFDALEKTKLWQDIDEAEGKGLDLIGSNVAEPRRGKDDEEYRLHIKVKIVRNLSGGEIETLNTVIPFFINGELIGIREGWTLDGDPFNAEEAAMLVILNQSMAKNNPIPYDIINSIAAGGVGIPYWELRYKVGIGLRSEYERQLISKDTNIGIETSFNESEQRFRYAGNFNCGEEWILW